MTPIPLAMDGANPLGFLAALGVVCVLSEDRPSGDGAPLSGGARLGWSPARAPILFADGIDDETTLIDRLVERLRRTPPNAALVDAEKAARSAFEVARRAARHKDKEIKERGLRGKPRQAALEAELSPLAGRAEVLRGEWRRCRLSTVPDPSVSLGLDLTVPSSEFSEHAEDALRTCSATDKRWADLCAAFGVATLEDQMKPTPFALISGSGHQHFLGTAGELMVQCGPEHLCRALFGSWTPVDEGLSFRWDPDDDRRYALLAQDPTASGNKPVTLWGANRLAFEALRFFPCFVGARGRQTTGWRVDEAGVEVLRWPIWSGKWSVSVIRSLLCDGDLWKDKAEARRRLRARGVDAVFAVRRLAVGSAMNRKLNLSRSAPVW